MMTCSVSAMASLDSALRRFPKCSSKLVARRILYHCWDDRFIFKHLCRCKVKQYLSNLLVCFSLIFHDYIAVGLLILIVFFVTVLTCIPLNQLEGDVFLVGEGFPDGFGLEMADYEFQTTNVSF